MRSYRRIPKRTPKLNRLQQHGLRLLEREVIPQPEADAHGTEAGGWDLNVGEGEGLGHCDESGTMVVRWEDWGWI